MATEKEQFHFNYVLFSRALFPAVPYPACVPVTTHILHQWKEIFSDPHLIPSSRPAAFVRSYRKESVFILLRDEEVWKSQWDRERGNVWEGKIGKEMSGPIYLSISVNNPPVRHGLLCLFH